MTFSTASVRRGFAWTVAIAIALAVLAAVGVRASATGPFGIRRSLDAVRLLAAGVCAAAAVVASRRASRSEAVGLGLAATVLALCVAADHGLLAWVPRGDDASARVLVASLAWSGVVLGLPIALGCALLKIPAVDLLAMPRRPLGPLVAAVVAGVLLYPALSLLHVGAEALASAALGPSPGGTQVGWPGFRVAALRESFPAASSRAPAHLFLLIAIRWPLLELLLHGVLRQAFLRWGAMPFVVATAVLAGLVQMRTSVDVFAFGGSLLTGWLAARSGSVFPGVFFWAAHFAGWVFWGLLIPPA